MKLQLLQIDSPRMMRCGSRSKPKTGCREAIPKQKGRSLHRVERGPRVMWIIINALYEEYCQARLDEMLLVDAAK
ncbi:hypothetical protein ACVWZL_007358 [Bradyrhizobium sp. GM2.4]